MVSPYRAKAKRRERLRHIRRNAPRHPPGPEARLRLIVARLMQLFHARIRRELVTAAATRQLNWQRRGGELGRTYSGLRSYGQDLLGSKAVKSSIRTASRSTAKSVREQVSKALGVTAIATTLEAEAEALEERLTASVDARMEASLARADEVWASWSEGDGDAEALSSELESGLDGVAGSALASVALLFGAAFAEMNQEAQTSEGVESYVWIAQRDKYTRPAHAALDNTVDQWDDPPLSAAESSNGEPCHPGDDFNCRCLAGPVPA